MSDSGAIRFSAPDFLRYISGMRDYAAEHGARVDSVTLSSEMEFLIDAAFLKGELSPALTHDVFKKHIRTYVHGIRIGYSNKVDLGRGVAMLSDVKPVETIPLNPVTPEPGPGSPNGGTPRPIAQAARLAA